MKISCILSSILSFIFTISWAQETENLLNRDRIGISFSSFGDNEVIRFQSMEGGPGIKGKNYFGMGVNYLNQVNNWLELGTGLDYLEHKITVDPINPPSLPNTYGNNTDNNSNNGDPYDTKVYIFNVSFEARAHFLQYFFANGGIMLNIDATTENLIDPQTGLGGF